MNVALTIPVADMHGNGGWWVLGAVMMMLFMGGMMWMMMRGMGGSSARDSSPPSDRFVSRESPMETLERRFAEGEISIEEYEARRDALVDGSAQPSGDRDERPLVVPRAGEGGQS